LQSRSAGVGTNTQENKEIVRRLMDEVLSLGRMEILPELVAAEYVGHFAIGDHYGPAGVRIEVVAYRTALPDLVVTLEDLLADGDKVIRRFTLRGTHRGRFIGAPPSGRLVALRGIAIDRLTEGRLVESWIQIDDFPRMAD
jgi:predicted ester cyclase